MNFGNCLFCHAKLANLVLDLGMSPLANSYLLAEQGNQMEPYYPLRFFVCEHCFLAQVEAVETPHRIFSEYAYFSSVSASWLEHCRLYADRVTRRFELTPKSFVVELASNDGYLLQYFVKNKIPVLGIEPAANIAKVAEARGIPTLVEFFGAAVARELVDRGPKADLLIGNNVLAHVPHLNDFVAGMKILLGPTGVITMEFPHLLNLLKDNQFDTIYHEHFSYFSLSTVKRVFEKHGLGIFDVEELDTHGGSIRIFATHLERAAKLDQTNVNRLMEEVKRAGLDNLDTYRAFSKNVREHRNQIMAFLIEKTRAGKSFAAFGAPAKGNTLLNYCALRTDYISYTVDDTPAKQGKLLPGTHIPIFATQKLRETKPDYVVILPWNFKDEIMKKHSYISEWGGRFLVFSPEVKEFAP